MIMIIYIVYGETGEYDDYRKWDCKAFKNKKKAKIFMNLCQKYADKIKYWDWFKQNYPENGPDPHFDYFDLDSTGTTTTYNIFNLELVE
jgi:hypothetical protein